MKTRATRIIPAVLLLLNSLGSSAWAAAYSIGYQGQLRQNGVPATGAHSVVFKIYPTETGGTPVWTGPTETVSFTNGQFFSTFTPTGVDWEGTSPVLEVSIDGTALTPREALSAIPYAFNAQLHSGKKYTTAASAPSSPAAGDLWYDSAAGALKYFNGTLWVSPGSGAAAIVSQAAQFSGDGSVGQPLTLLSSSVTLQGNAVNLANGLVRLDASGRYPALDGSLITNLPSSADRVAKTGDTMTGDLQVGGATASTFSISGFITLANLGGAPGAARGRFYFDPTGTGAFKVSLDGSTFVSLATGTVAGADNSRVLKAGDTMTGQLTNTSTITVQGNAFSVGGSTLVVVNGNVGIGTMNPSSKLEIQGGNLVVGGAAASTIKGDGTDSSIGGSLGINNQADLIFYLDNGITQTGKMTVGTPGLYRFEDSLGTHGANLNASNSILTADRTFTFPDLTGTLALLENPQNFTGTKTFSNATYSALFTGGNVGVGTISPSARLHVSGGDTQVGDATASTISASGFITLANLGSAPSAARGRLYFDPTSAGAFKISLDGATFVSLATGTVSGADDSRVLKAGDTMTGQLTLSGSTATITGQDASGYSLKLSSGINMPAGTVTAGLFIGNGAGLSNVSATNIAAANVLAGALGPNVIASSIAVNAINDAGQLAAALSIPDARLATIATAGKVADSALSSNVSLLSANQAISGVQTFISTATITGQDTAGYSLKLSSGLSMPAGTVTAGLFVGNGAGLTGITGTDASRVLKAGDTMTGQLTTTSTVTIQGNAFSVGGSTLVVINGNVGIGTTAPAARLDVQATSGAYESAVFRNPSGVAVATVTAAGVFAGTNQWSFTIYDPGGLVASDDIPSIIAARVSSATIKEVWCESDDAAASINLEKFDGATTSILSGDLTCGTSGSSSASFTASANAQLNLNNKINFLLQSIGGGAKRINVVIKYALN